MTTQQDPEAFFNETVPEEDQDSILTRIIEAGPRDVGAVQQGLCIYEIGSIGMFDSEIIGSIEIGDRVFEFIIIDGQSNGTVIREWVEL